MVHFTISKIIHANKYTVRYTMHGWVHTFVHNWTTFQPNEIVCVGHLLTDALVRLRAMIFETYLVRSHVNATNFNKVRDRVHVRAAISVSMSTQSISRLNKDRKVRNLPPTEHSNIPFRTYERGLRNCYYIILTKLDHKLGNKWQFSTWSLIKFADADFLNFLFRF